MTPQRHDKTEKVDYRRSTGLDESTNDPSIVPLRAIINKAVTRLDHLSGITIKCNPTYPETLNIHLYTDKISNYSHSHPLSDETVDLALIEKEDGSRYVLPFTFAVRDDAPVGVETVDNTPIFVYDHVHGTVLRSVDNGLARLRAKLGKSLEEVVKMIRDDDH